MRISRPARWTGIVLALSLLATGCFSKQPNSAQRAIQAAARAERAAARAEKAAMQASQAASAAQAAAARVDQAASDAKAAADRAEAIAPAFRRHARHHRHRAKKAAASGPPIAEHRYILFDHEKAEPEGFGAYTYVLLPLDFQDLTDLQGKRYQALLAAIHGAHSPLSSALTFSEMATNLFCVPAKSRAGDIEAPENYNVLLARRLLEFTRKSVPRTDRYQVRLHNPGPFLITTVHQRLEELSAREPLLLDDLSHTNPLAMDEAIAEYEQKLEGHISDQPEIFDPLRLKLLSIIYDAQDGIPNIKVITTAFIP